MSTRAIACAAACLAALTGCENAPVALTPDFNPPMGWLREAAPKNQPKTEACRLNLAAIKDTRLDPGSMGSIGYRTVRMNDPATWFRAGFLAMNRDPRVKVSEGASDADLTLEVDVLKAYVMSITSDKTSAVLLRVRYSRAGTPLDEQVYRGEAVGWNWNSGDDESKSALNQSLAGALTQIRRDALARCPEKPVVGAS